MSLPGRAVKKGHLIDAGVSEELVRKNLGEVDHDRTMKCAGSWLRSLCLSVRPLGAIRKFR